MKARTIARIAWTGLRRNRMRTVLMMAGIVVGITSLTMVLSAAYGAEQRVMERVRKFGLDSVMVNAGPSRDHGRTAGGQPVVTLKVDDAEALKREVRSIVEVAPFNRQPGTDISWQGRSTTAPVFGVTPAWAPVWDWDAADGEFITDEDMQAMARTCVLGPTVLREIFGDADPMGETIQVGAAPFVVKGVMSAKGISPGGGDMDNRVYVPLSTFMRRVANVDHLSGIKVRLKSVKDIETSVAPMTAVLRDRHRLGEGVPDDFAITTPTEITEMAGEVAGTFSILLVLVAGISLLAGGVVVANIMLISVNERRREIGLRKAVGAKSRDIRSQFLLEATAITLAGGVIGIVLGMAGAGALEWLGGTPAGISWKTVAAGVVFSSLVGIVAGLHPARRAAAQVPVDALRG
jgi:putative ABC transport system permease protein